MARPAGKQTISKRGLSPLARDIVESLEEYAAFRRGEKTGAKVVRVSPTNVPEDVDVKSIRSKLGMTQEQFASFGFSLIGSLWACGWRREGRPEACRSPEAYP